MQQHAAKKNFADVLPRGATYDEMCLTAQSRLHTVAPTHAKELCLASNSTLWGWNASLSFRKTMRSIITIKKVLLNHSTHKQISNSLSMAVSLMRMWYLPISDVARHSLLRLAMAGSHQS